MRIATAGGVVYPKSPFNVVPETVLLYVLDKITKVFAAPSPGEVAAEASGAVIKVMRAMVASPIVFINFIISAQGKFRTDIISPVTTTPGAQGCPG